MAADNVWRQLARTRRLATRIRGKVELRLALRGIGPGVAFESRLVWVFGSPRSGSTWLLQMLSGIPGVVPINEPLIGQHLGALLSDYRGVRIEDLDVSNFTFERQRRHVPDQFFSQQFEDVWSPLLGRFIKARLLASVATKAPVTPLSEATIIVKEPNGSQAADLILGGLPHSSVLFLIRDGRDVVDSELAATAAGGWAGREFSGVAAVEGEDRMEFVVRSASKWLWRTEVLQEEMRRHPGPTFTVKYEDLRTDTLRHLRALSSWLKLSAPDETLQRIVADTAFEALPAAERGPDKFYRSAQPGAWRENLSDREQAAVERVIGAKLTELGYEV
jgi:hypothetical protein